MYLKLQIMIVKLAKEWFIMMIAIIVIVYIIASMVSGTFDMSIWEQDTRDLVGGVASVPAAVLLVVQIFRGLL